MRLSTAQLAGWACLAGLTFLAMIDGTMAFTLGFVIVLWFVPIYLGGKIMAGKGRSKGAGYALGFLLGWLGVLITACLGTDAAYALREVQGSATAREL